ncbi:MAG: nucleotidyl transferase AbiEii/AbiGii toxin family protein [Verrucomicrobiota bacterium]|jgi:hypothetical protein
MELYKEFFHLIRKLNEQEASYSVVGGIALAFHSLPRFTRDIDILGVKEDIEKYGQIFTELGYISLGSPWTFENTNITLHRYGKRSQESREELLVVDLLIGNEPSHMKVIEQSIIDESPAGNVRLARREDLIWMKQLRSSPQDLVDIENLRKSHDQD